MSYHIGIFSPPTTVTLIIDGGIIIACHKAYLNGEYENTNYAEAINWYYWKGFD